MNFLIIVLLAVVASIAGVKKTICPSACDYTTVQACEDNFTKSYAGVGLDTCYLSTAGTYSGAVTVSGQTNTDGNNNLLFLGPAMTGISGDATHAIISYNITSGATMQTTVPWIKFKLLEFANTGASAALSNNGVFVMTGADILADRIIATTNGNQSCIVTTQRDTIRNFMAINTSAYTGRYQVQNVGGANFITTNGILYGAGPGWYNQSGSGIATNVYSYSSASASFSVIAGSLTQSYTASDDSTASGTGSLTNISLVNADFVSAPTNLLITSSSSLYNVGTDLSSTFTTDIAGTTWSAWSIAANNASPPVPPAADFLCADGYCATVSATNHDSVLYYWKSDTTAGGLLQEYAFGVNTGTRTSTSIVRSKFTKACSLTVSPAASVAFSNINISGRSKFSLATVFNVASTATAFRCVYSVFNSGTNRFLMYTNGTTWYWGLDAGLASFNMGSEFVANRYHAVVVVYDGAGATDADRLKVWIDGTQRTLSFTGTVPATKATNTEAFYFTQPGTYTLNGKVDELAIWKGTLTDEQAVLLSANGAIRASFPAIATNRIYSWGRATPYSVTVNPTVLSRTTTLSIKDSTFVTTFNSKAKTIAIGDSAVTDSVAFSRGGWARQYISSDYAGLPLLRDSSTYTFGIGPLFLAVGQSNMVGLGDAPYTAVNYKSSMFRRGQWLQTADPVDTNKTHVINFDYNSTQGASMFPSFINTLTPRINAPIGIIPSAVNGTAIWATPSTGSNWLYPVNPLTDTALNIFNPAVVRTRYTGFVDGVIWYQGEGDAAYNHSTQDYTDSLTKLIRNFRDSINQGNQIPFFMVPIANATGGAYTPANLAAIRAGTEAVNNSVTNTEIWCRPYDLGYAVKADGVHLTTASQDLLGACMAEGYYNFYYGINTNRRKSPMWRMGMSPR